MPDEQGSEKPLPDQAGITAGGNVSFGNVSGQVAIGRGITQTQTISAPEKKELLECLRKFREEIEQLNLPEEELSTVKGDLSAAIKETEKNSPDPSKIKSRFQGALDAINTVAGAVDKIIDSPTTAKILNLLGKLGISILLR
jgi:hypothetical protein